MRLTLRKALNCKLNKRSFSTLLPMPNCDFKPSQYEGPSLPHLMNLKQEVINPCLTTLYTTPLAIHQGYKQWLFDFEGKRYLDLFGGICTVSVGHAHPKVTEAVTKQISTVGHLANIYITPKMYEYAKKLTDTLPGNLKSVFFVNSGTEANDLAVMLARAFTQNFEIIALRNCYHGINCQMISLTTNSLYKQNVPSAPGFHHVMTPDIYRGIWGGKHCRDSPVQTNRNCNCTPEQCTAGEYYAEQLVDVYKYNIPKKGAAAFFTESIQGVGGVIQFPTNYLKKAYSTVKEHGGLFVVDEVQTGFGRTGEHFWGFEMHDIIPDIVTMAKGIGNGFPLAAVVTTPEIAHSLSKSTYFNTFGGNPVACTAGTAVLEVIEEEELQHNSDIVGTYLLNKLAELKKECPLIGDVRGKGLMIGVELVNKDGSNTPFDEVSFMKYLERCRDLGLLLGTGGYFRNVLRFTPPMCITKEDADFAIAVMQKIFLEFL